MQHIDALSHCNIFVLETNSFEENLMICQGKKYKIVKIRKKLEMSEDKFYERRNGVLYKKKDEILLFCVPQEMEPYVMFKCHDESHLKLLKVYSLFTSLR